ncbi:hypothetical protein EIN_304760, partial [Entamoeba invadens IP1]
MSRIDGYHIMIVSSYFTTIKDFITVEFVCKKYFDNLSKFHYNPIPISKQTRKYFSRLETLHLYSSNSTKLNGENFHSIVFHYQVTFDELLNIKDLYKNNCIIKNGDLKIRNKLIFKNINIMADQIIHIPQKYLNCVRSVSCCDYHFSINLLEIPSFVTSLNTSSFACKTITSVKLPQNLKVLRSWAFYNVNHLKEIEIPKSVTFIGRNCFCHCTNLVKA